MKRTENVWCAAMAFFFSGDQSKFDQQWRMMLLAIVGWKWWTLQVSNLRPLPCEGNALPLS
jgi:hypothetical protein